MHTKTVVALIFIDKNQNILLQDRKTISKYGEEGSFFGGHLEQGETIIQTAQREAMEELHLSLSENQIHYIGTTVHYLQDREIEYIRHLCLIPVEDVTSLQLTDHEGSGVHIFSLSQLEKLKFNTDVSQEKILIEYHLGNSFSNLQKHE